MSCASHLSAYSPPMNIPSPSQGPWDPLSPLASRATNQQILLLCPSHHYVALQKSFLAIFVHKAGLRESCGTINNLFPLQSEHFQTLLLFSQFTEEHLIKPSSIYSHDSKILAPLPTSSLKLSESKGQSQVPHFWLP